MTKLHKYLGCIDAAPTPTMSFCPVFVPSLITEHAMWLTLPPLGQFGTNKWIGPLNKCNQETGKATP